MSDDEHLDEFEKDDMLVDKTDEKVDEAALRSALNNQLAESDKHMVDRLLKDIMSGDLRRRRAAKEMGLMLDDFDIYDDNDNDLVAIRLAAAERRRKLLEETGDGLELLGKKKNHYFSLYCPLTCKVWSSLISCIYVFSQGPKNTSICTVRSALT